MSNPVGTSSSAIRVAMLAVILAAAAFAERVDTQQPGGLASRAPTGGIEILHVRGNVYMMVGAGGNTTIQVGPQGVLVVDTMTEPMADQLVAAIERFAPGKPIRYVLNTHAHPDHTGGNLKVAEAGSQLVGGNFLAQLGQQGAQSAFIFAHENVLIALNGPSKGRAPVPFGALPTDTFFQDQKDLYFNGEAVQMLHMASAHTDGDSMVFFRSSDVISTGDLFVTTSYPRIDLERGGTVNGLIEALNTLIDLVVSEQYTEGGTRVVPGHGRLSDEMDVVEFRDMVTIVRDRVQDAMKRGQTLDQIKAARLTLDFDTRYGSTSGPWTTSMFVEAVYRTLSLPSAARKPAR